MANRLDLVNHLLQTVGERRVLSLETGHPSVVQAIQALEGYDFDFQGRGWWFNKNYAMVLVPNNLGEVLLPTEFLSVSVTQRQLQWLPPAEKKRYTSRGGRIYDAFKNSHNIGQSLTVDLTVRLPIEDLPPVAASYLKHFAAEQYYLDDDGDNQKVDKLSNRTLLAFHALKAEELKVQAENALDSPAAQHLTHRIGQYSGQHPLFPGGRYYS